MLLHGIERAANGSLSVTAAGTIVYKSGMPLTALGEVRTTATTGAPAAGSIVKQGVCFAADGTLRTTTDAIGKVVGGVAYTSLNVLCITTNAPAATSKQAFVPGIGMVLVDTTCRVHVS